MGYRVTCNPNQWTQVLWTAGPAPYWKNLTYVDPAHTRNDIKVRRVSAGVPWYWEGHLFANVPSVFWHTPELLYASVEVFPVNGGLATIEVM